jgi:hypothetical protein
MPGASNVMDVQAEVLVGAKQTALRTDGAEPCPAHFCFQLFSFSAFCHSQV